MRMMTFNLRFENDTDGDNAWQHRREMVVDIISRYQPAVLGTQEGKCSQIRYLQECLPEYEALTPGRMPDQKIQCPTLFFRKKEISIEGGKDFWLSKTPDVHLSKDWDSAFPRMLSFAEVRVEASYRKMVAAVTHLDNMGVEARYQQAKIIAQWANRQKAPVVLMGDFNDSPASRVHRALTVPETSLRDTWEMMVQEEGESSFTHHGFSGKPRLTRMDWILVDFNFKVTHVEIIRDNLNGKYPSDHFPYIADIEFTDQHEKKILHP
jgi:endonuclease/exonuclease/phosphatase family metal-dependent hydrolase